MKLTKSLLLKLIREEMEAANLLEEGTYLDDSFSAERRRYFDYREKQQ